MTEFWGREEQLGVLYRLLAEASGDPGEHPAQVVSITGPRRVGKSRLLEEFLARAVVPYVYFPWTAQPGASAAAGESAARRFVEAGATSTLPGAALFARSVMEPTVKNGFAGATPATGWDAALRLLIEALPTDGPAVVVFDDVRSMAGADPSFEPTLQKVFDQELRSRRVLLIGIRPAAADGLFQLAEKLAVPVLAPSEIATRLHLAPADAFDAFLITGGLPSVVDEWPPGASIWEHLGEVLRSPTSALLVNAERLLAAEFPTQAQAREVLAVIGAGRRSFADIGRAAGNPPQGSLSRALSTLRDKGLIAAELPLSTVKSAETRYRATDPYLRFWLSFLGPGLLEIERGRGDLVLRRIRAAWPNWRSRAIEPVIREALSRMLTAPQPLTRQGLPRVARPETRSAEPGDSTRTVAVGGYWTRSSNPEIDVVIADRAPVASRVIGLGAITWCDDPLDDDDYGRLLAHRGQLPGADRTTPVFAVSRSGSSVPGLRIYPPEELLAAW